MLPAAIVLRVDPTLAAKAAWASCFSLWLTEIRMQLEIPALTLTALRIQGIAPLVALDVYAACAAAAL